MIRDPIVVDEFILEMIFDNYKDYGGRILLEGHHRISGNKRSSILASTHQKEHQNDSGFGKRIADELSKGELEFLESTSTGGVQLDSNLFKRINLEKYLIAYCHKTGIKLIKWDITVPDYAPPVSKMTFANFNPKELIAVLAVAIKENASNLGIRCASFDIPSLEKDPEIYEFMKKHLTRAI